MCLSPDLTEKIVHVAKFTAPLFWAMEIVLVANVIKPAYFVAQNIKFINTMLRYQGVEEQIKSNEKVIKIFKRDVTILLVLNALVIVLIELI